MTLGRRVLVGAWVALGAGGLAVSRARADGDAMAPASGGAPARLTPEMQRRFDEADRDRDGRIQPDEWPLGDATFRQADRDRDGALTAREVLRWKVLEDARKAKLGDALRQKFREADKDGDGVISRAEFVFPEPLWARFDRDGDGQVTFVEALYVGTEEEVGKSFAQHDRDLSGALSLEETPPQHHEAFLAADVDGDGELTGAESHAFLMELQLELVGDAPAPPPTAARPTAPASRPATTSLPPPARRGRDGVGVRDPALRSAVGVLLERFAASDRDHDGKLGPAEVGLSRALLERLDVDRDGAVDEAELRLRLHRADAAIERAEGLKQRAQALGLGGDDGSPVGAEALGLLTSGRVEELEQLLDELELVLARLEAGKGR